MRIRLRDLKRLLREELDMGEIVFSPARVDGVSRDEPNTPDEQKLFDELATWVFDNEFTSGYELMKLLKVAASEPRYSQFFGPPREKVVYRGLNNVSWELVSEDWLVGPANAEALDKMDNSRTGEAECDFVIRADGGIASWTVDPFAGERFAKRHNVASGRGEDAMTGYCNVVLIANVDDNPGKFVDINEIQRRVDGLGKVMQESEVIGFDRIRVRGIKWFY